MRAGKIRTRNLFGKPEETTQLRGKIQLR